MSPGEAGLLVLAGIGGGLSGSIAGIASFVSYPALLALGLNPLAANVTNTVALVCSSTGTVLGSRPELTGHGRTARHLLIPAVLGGALGGLLLLVTPADVFGRLVPILIGAASIAVLVRPRPQRHEPGAAAPRELVVAVFLTGIYGGYFGAAAGVMLLAALLYLTGLPLPVAAGLRSLLLGAANLVAAAGFALFGPVDWAVALPLAVGFLIGGSTGPLVLRRAPAGPLRVLIAVAGMVVAIHLALQAY